MRIGNGSESQPRRAVPGIVIRLGTEPPRQPTVLAFIWGGKTAPIPALPFGRGSAA